MKREEILDFCGRWLSDWEGNRPDDLIRFYSDDAVYIDPANKDGLKGHDRIFTYFKNLLAANPKWKWNMVEVFPTDAGFVLKWKATIPIGLEVVTEYGMDIVEIEQERISRNEVYFDRSHLLETLRRTKS